MQFTLFYDIMSKTLNLLEETDLLNKIIAILLSLAIMFSLSACGKDAKSDTASSSEVVSSEDVSSENSSSVSGGVVEEEYAGDAGGGKHDGTVVQEQDDTPQEENRYNPALNASSGTIDGTSFTSAVWEGPADYSIVYQNKNESAKGAALRLQSYFQKNGNASINVIPDTVSETEKEILVGKTNRSESDHNVGKNTGKVSVLGKKLVFDGGRDDALEAVVKLFCRLGFKNGYAHTLSKTISAPPTCFLSGYDYVWGDEFNDDDIDLTKWCFNDKMGNDGKAKVSYDKSVIYLSNGQLHLRGIKNGTEYKVPHSVSSETHMNYVYGYAEIKAKLPFFQGAWPSFWGQSTQSVSSKYGVYRNVNYMVEVDVFEVFGSPNQAVSNIHKWYNGGGSIQWPSDKKDVWTGNKDTVNTEWHTYGYEWTPTKMIMYVDGNKIMTYDIATNFGEFDMKGFHDPQFLMFNNHLFNEKSDWRPSGNLIENNEKMLPACYDIEYFRVFQKNDGKSKIYVDRTPSSYNR